MKTSLKKLNNQVIVITGASSGIGLVTARMAARYGTRLVLNSRNEDALQQVIQEIREAGGQAIHVTGDVSREEDVRKIASEAVGQFGGIDTWVNNAGVSIYGRLTEIPIVDMRRLFEINFWGVVHGSRIAVEHMRRRGGALINVGSTVSDRAIPLQGIYSASKHAVKGFTDALRMELEEQGVPISVTLIKPSSIDTPLPEHARNYLPVEPKLPPPVYAPELAAEAILHAAEHPTRDVFVGSGGKGISAMGRFSPRLTDRFMEKSLFRMQQTDRPAAEPSGALYSAGVDLRERGNYPGTTRETSVYTSAALHPLITSAMAIGAGLALAAWWGARRQ